jgi:hypothetical protein
LEIAEEVAFEERHGGEDVTIPPGDEFGHFVCSEFASILLKREEGGNGGVVKLALNSAVDRARADEGLVGRAEFLPRGRVGLAQEGNEEDEEEVSSIE